MKIFIHVVLFFISSECFCQRTFAIDNASKNYLVKLTVDTCDDMNCEGRGTIQLFSKKNKLLFQTLSSDDLYFFLDSTQKPTSNIIQLYNEQSPVIFDDFNFDQSEDIAVRNGNNSGYGGPSYDVYVFNKTRNQFVLSVALTKLATENLGMFYTNHETKRIETFAKSGCCWHMTTEYEVVPNKGLVKVYELTEDATHEKYTIVTTRKLINGKWVKSVKRYKKEED